MTYNRIPKTPELRSKQGGRGGHTTTVFDILPYLMGIGSCVFDCRHFVYDTIGGIMPFPVTTRIAANNQQYLFINQEI